MGFAGDSVNQPTYIAPSGLWWSCDTLTETRDGPRQRRHGLGTHLGVIALRRAACDSPRRTAGNCAQLPLRKLLVGTDREPVPHVDGCDDH